jgi:glucose/mannose transport system substrate-binding protein
LAYYNKGFLNTAQAAGIIPLAIGREAWEHTLLFDSVAAGVGGAEFYRHAFIDLNAEALAPELLLVIFQRMSQLRTYLDHDFGKRYWDDATKLVFQGAALLALRI